MSKLYIVSTPIGNLSDITLRALETLKNVDLVVCEDSRRTGTLLNHYEIKKPLRTFEQYREEKEIPVIIDLLKNDRTVALVSDSGTPAISDPGFKLIRECIKQNIQVIPIPGPSAAISALVTSGLPTDKFLFVGFLPEKSSHRQKTLEKLKEIFLIQPMTFVIYESPYGLIKTLQMMFSVFADIDIVIARELTKIHEEQKRIKISEALEYYKKNKPKGEITIVFYPNLSTLSSS